MKMKFTAAAALAVWLLVTAWLASMVIVKPAVLHLGHDADESAAMSQLRYGVAHNRQMQEQVAQLRQSSYTGTGQPLLALAAVAPVNAADGIDDDGIATGNNVSGSDPSSHMVTIVLTTNGQHSAIIDGRHVRAGARLNDGSRVAAIGADWVRIDGADGTRHTHAVRSPYQNGKGAPR